MRIIRTVPFSFGPLFLWTNDQLNNTAIFTRVIEDFVKKYPEQWFWLHQRWKSRPENDPNKGTERLRLYRRDNKLLV